MKSIGIGIVVGMLGAGGVFAQPAADTDGDGVLSLAELQAFRSAATEERFAALDTDGDGRLTREEMRASRGNRLDRIVERLATIDADGDGAWSYPELQAVRPEMSSDLFNRLDTNGDGLINEIERPMRRGGFGGRGPRQL